MNSRSIFRNGRTRTAIAVMVITASAFVGYSYHSTYKQLNEEKRAAKTCQQDQQELLARMQVVHDHKSRLEKSLEQGKLENKKMRDELMSRAEDEKGQWQREKLELQNQYSSLKQQYNLLKSLNDELQAEFDQLTKNNNGLVEEKTQLEHAQHDTLSQVSALQAEIQKHKDQISDLEEQRSTANRRAQELQQQYMQASENNELLKNQITDLTKHNIDVQDKLDACTSGHVKTEVEVKETKADLEQPAHEDNGVLPLPGDQQYINKEDKLKISSEGNPHPAPIAPAPHADTEFNKSGSPPVVASRSKAKTEQETVILKPGTNEDTKISPKENLGEIPLSGQVQDRLPRYSFQKPQIRHPSYHNKMFPKPRAQNHVLLGRPNANVIYGKPNKYYHNQIPPQGFLPVPPGFDAGKYHAQPNQYNHYEKHPPLGANWNRPVYHHGQQRDDDAHQLEQPALGLGKRDVDKVNFNEGENHLEEPEEFADTNPRHKVHQDYDFEQEQGEEGEGDGDEEEREGKVGQGNAYALDAPPQLRDNQQDFRSNKRQGNGKNGFHYLEDGVMVQPK